VKLQVQIQVSPNLHNLQKEAKKDYSKPHFFGHLCLGLFHWIINTSIRDGSGKIKGFLGLLVAIFIIIYHSTSHNLQIGRCGETKKYKRWFVLSRSL
jgi:hypothetical protein